MPLCDPEPIVGMFKISRSTCNHRHNAAVVSVGDIMEDSHLSVFTQGEIDLHGHQTISWMLGLTVMATITETSIDSWCLCDFCYVMGRIFVSKYTLF